MAGRLAARTGLSKAIGREAVDGVFAAIGDGLANGEEVGITRFGTFGTRSRAAGTGCNPRTGEAVSVSASTSPTFTAGKTLKDAVKAGPGSWTQQRQPTATRSASDRLNMESSRLLCDDARTTSCPTGVRKTQGVRRVGSCAVAGAHAASRIWQEVRQQYPKGRHSDTRQHVTGQNSGAHRTC